MSLCLAALYSNPPGNRVFNHPSTADAWIQEEAELKEQYWDKGKDVKLAAVVFYSDKTNRRTIGAQTYYPMYITLANFESDVFAECSTKAIVGWIPWEEKPDKANGDLWKSLVDDVVMHMWGAALESLEEAIANEPLELPLKDGKILLLCPRMLYFIGDFPELQLVCGCKGAHSANFPCRVCVEKREGTGNLSSLEKGKLRTVSWMQEVKKSVERGWALDKEGNRIALQSKASKSALLSAFGLSIVKSPFYKVTFAAAKVREGGERSSVAAKRAVRGRGD